MMGRAQNLSPETRSSAPSSLAEVFLLSEETLARIVRMGWIS
jgi:hypothetical protein